MLRADFGAAPSGEGWDAIRASERLANIEKLVKPGARAKLSLSTEFRRHPSGVCYRLPIRD